MTMNKYLIGLTAALSACSQNAPEKDGLARNAKQEELRPSRPTERVARASGQMTEAERDAQLRQQMEPVMSSAERKRQLLEQMKRLPPPTNTPG